MKLICAFIFLAAYTSAFEIPQTNRTVHWSDGITKSVYNSTDHIIDILRSTGRSLTDNIQSYYHKLNSAKRNMLDYVDEKQKNLTEKFGGYLERARATGRKLIDTVKPARKGKEHKVDCSNQPLDIFMTTPQLIALHGYRAESHTILTEDGYLLTIHRIPHSTFLPRRTSPKTILLHHGLLGSSADWVLAGPKHSLAYILSDAGYDVWMANIRGNIYSKMHVSRDVDSYEFWNFTWHDAAQYDLPAVIDYIYDVKGDPKINYVGHSMGTTMLFSLLSTRPEYNKKLRAGFALAPVAYMSEIRSPIRLLAPLSRDIEKLFKMLGVNEFLPQNWVLKWLSVHACDINEYEEAICENSLFVLCGHDQGQFNKTLLPIILGHVPAGASTKSLVHYAQEIHSGGNFQQYDYGVEGNLKEYGQEKPPLYPVEKITLPMALISAHNDWLAGEKDVSRLYNDLPNKIEHYVVPLKEFNHIDFLWAIDAPKLVYLKLIKMMARV